MECGNDGNKYRDVFCVEVHSQNRIILNSTLFITSEKEVYENTKVADQYCEQQQKPVKEIFHIKIYTL